MSGRLFCGYGDGAVTTQNLSDMAGGRGGRSFGLGGEEGRGSSFSYGAEEDRGSNFGYAAKGERGVRGLVRLRRMGGGLVLGTAQSRVGGRSLDT